MTKLPCLARTPVPEGARWAVLRKRRERRSFDLFLDGALAVRIETDTRRNC